MNKNRFFIIVFIVLIALAGVWVFGSQILPKFTSAVGKAAGKAVYYCPMHPSYTSDRPGDCPICNMKLVRREAGTAPTVPARPAGSKDICYLHNCPKVHEGKPCPMLVVAKAGEKVTCPICGTHVTNGAHSPQEKKILYWTDPMIPGYKSDKPGKSPMGMDLVPVYEEQAGLAPSGDEPAGYAPVLLSLQKQQLIGVKTAPVRKMPMGKTIRTVGRIAYDPELYQAEEEYVQAVQALKKAEAGTLPEVKEQASRLVDSARLRLKLLGLGPNLIQEVEQAGKPDRSLLYGEAGGTVWMYAPIYEYEMPLVKVGDKLNVEVAAVPARQFEAVIRSIDPVIDPVTRTVRVRAVLQNPEGLLKPEMYVNTTLNVDLGDVLSVPEGAVFRTGDKNIVFIEKSEGFFDPREVKLGSRTEGAYEVKSGLAEGEQVVISGNFLIDSESRLKSALEGAAGGGHQHAA